MHSPIPNVWYRSRWLPLLSACLVVALLAALAVPQQSLGKFRNCGATFGGDEIKTTGVKCNDAKKIVRAWGHRADHDGKFSRTVYGFRCRPYGEADGAQEGEIMSCKKGRRTISFYSSFDYVYNTGD